MVWMVGQKGFQGGARSGWIRRESLAGCCPKIRVAPAILARHAHLGCARVGHSLAGQRNFILARLHLPGGAASEQEGGEHSDAHGLGFTTVVAIGKQRLVRAARRAGQRLAWARA
jgi:hypothetical protein